MKWTPAFRGFSCLILATAVTTLSAMGTAETFAESALPRSQIIKHSRVYVYPDRLGRSIRRSRIGNPGKAYRKPEPATTVHPKPRPPPPPPPPPPQAPSGQEQELLRIINQERGRNGSPPLQSHSRLNQSALNHAADMKRRNFLSLTNPDGVGYKDRIKTAGYMSGLDERTCHCTWSTKISELYAKGSRTPEVILRRWLDNPSSSDQLKSSGYKDIGIGNVEDIWVIDLGRIDIVQKEILTEARRRAYEEEVIRLTNIERSNVGLPGLHKNDILARTALGYAKELFHGNFFSHDTPDGRTLRDRFRSGGYPDGYREYSYGENLAKGQDTPAEVVREWMASPPHRVNIVSPTFEEIGVAFYEDTWVQHFGRKR